MSRKERIQAFKVLLDLIRRHEGEWTREKLIAEFSFRYGYTQKKTEEYLSALVDAGKVRLGEVSVYTYESEEKVKEVEKE